MKNLSALYEILIYIEDRGTVDAQEIKNWGNAVSRGVLGKMDAMELLEKIINKGTISYKLSLKGYGFLNSILDVLHQNIIRWDGKWRFVWFSVSEKNRPKRDKFRRHLEALGLRPILNSAWITPLDLSAKIINYAKELKIENNLIYIEAAKIAGFNQEDLLNAWDFDEYKQKYESFITDSQNLINSKQQSRFEFKKMIFKYAILLNNQPKLPTELLPKDWPYLRAQMQYKRIKRLIG